MGHGVYCCSTREVRSATLGYMSKSADEIFTRKSINNAMNPKNIPLRESRDSKEHPNSVPIILGLDVTGSMGSVPHHLVRNGLPKLVSKIIQKGIPDPQILFLGIGDHEVDDAPLQISQFESSDELLDKWLTELYIEQGGGSNAGESYLLAWYVGAYKTVTDSWEKRKQKGLLFTIGDEPTLDEFPKHAVSNIIGEGQHENFTAEQLLKKAMEKYNVFHVHVKETASGSRPHVIDGWAQLMHENLIIAEHRDEIPDLIADKVISVVTGKKVIAEKKKKPVTPDIDAEEVEEGEDAIPEML